MKSTLIFKPFSSPCFANTVIAMIVAMLALPAMSQDFANLDRFQAQNQKLRRTETRVNTVLLGDSIVARWPRSRPRFFEQTTWTDRGIVGETTPQMLLRFRQDVLELKPERVIILAGTNDIAGNSGLMAKSTTVANLQSMIELARFHKIEPVLCSVLPAARYPWSPGKQPALEIPKLNELIESLAQRTQVTYVDLFSAMTDGQGGMRDTLSDDGVHPNNLGYAVMERQLLGTLDVTAN